MSGGFVMEWEDAAARVRLAELVERGTHTRPLMLEIGYELVRSTLQRFEDEVDPDGNPWVELKPATLARKKGSKKLIEGGFLRGGVSVLEASDSFVEIGADREYAAIHQFGGKASMPPGPAAVPVRAIFGTSRSDVEGVRQAIESYIALV